MTALTATRTELLRRRSAIAFAAQGRDLLVDKRMALVRELHRLDADVSAQREAAAVLAREARALLDESTADEGPAAVAAVASGAANGVVAEREDRMVVGVRVVTVQANDLRRTAEERGAAPVLVAPSIEAAAEAYERYLEHVLRFVALEATVRRLTEEVARTTRQVNALENVVIPGLEEEAAHITAVLEEREREEHSRLKRARERRRVPQDRPAPDHPPVPRPDEEERR
ncbi:MULTISPECIES: V-type ATP synthase subunit D [Actinomycetes]|uniref:V-type ATP synthase subunit D n=1 Tax=Actinomycetes TaxID=1760 RepID=UPI00082B8FE4|nr:MULTISPECIES: V-type ATP synthase subunit D [Actinomycetes]QSR31632.1 V-type ATP synthase subunit D [Nocardioides sp. S5]